MPAQEHFGDFLCNTAKTRGDAPQQLKPSFAVVAERKPLTQVGFASVQPAEDESQQEVLGGHLRQLVSEAEHNRLIDAQPLDSFHLLFEGLKQRRRGLRMQHGARVWVECNHRRGYAEGTSALHNAAHYELMSEMKPVEHPEGEHSGRADLAVIDVTEYLHLVRQAASLSLVSKLIQPSHPALISLVANISAYPSDPRQAGSLPDSLVQPPTRHKQSPPSQADARWSQRA